MAKLILEFPVKGTRFKNARTRCMAKLILKYLVKTNGKRFKHARTGCMAKLTPGMLVKGTRFENARTRDMVKPYSAIPGKGQGNAV